MSLQRVRVELCDDTLRWCLSWLDVPRELPRVHRVCKQWQTAAKRCEEKVQALRLFAMRDLPAWLGSANAARWARQVRRLELRLPPFTACAWSKFDMRRFCDWVRSMPLLRSLHVQHLTSEQGWTCFPPDTWHLSVPLTSLSLIDAPASGAWIASQRALTDLSFGANLYEWHEWHASTLPTTTVLPKLRTLDWSCASSHSAKEMLGLITAAPWHRFPCLQRLIVRCESADDTACSAVCAWWERDKSTLLHVIPAAFGLLFASFIFVYVGGHRRLWQYEGDDVARFGRSIAAEAAWAMAVDRILVHAMDGGRDLVL